MPVSRTSKRILTRSARFATPAATSIATSPPVVNLMALPTRLTRIWRRRPGSPRRNVGTSGSMRQTSSRPFSWARTASSSAASSSMARRSKSSVLQLQLAGLDLGEVEDVVDDAEQRLAARAHGSRRSSRCSAVRLGVQQQLGHADDAVHGRADLVAHVGQELALGDVGRLGLEGQLVGPLGGGLEPAVGLFRSAIASADSPRPACAP